MVGRLVSAIAMLLASLAGVMGPAGGRARHVAARHAERPLLERLSLQQLAGQRIVYSYAGFAPPQSLLAAIRAGEAGGVIFFGPNVSTPRQLRRVIDELQRREPGAAPFTTAC